MIRRLSVATTLNLLSFNFGLFTCLLVGSLLVAQRYQVVVDDMIDNFENSLEQDLSVQFALYFKDQRVLERFLDSAMKSPMVDMVRFRDVSGGVLTERGNTRRQVSDEEGASADHVKEAREEIVVDGRSYLNVSLPVHVPVDPLLTQAQSRSYDSAYRNLDRTNSRHFSGYFDFSLDQDEIQASLFPYVKHVIVLLGSFLACYLLLSYLIIRRTTRPLSRLADFARDISAGRLDKPLRIGGSGEVLRLVDSLNLILEELNKHKSQVEVDNKLLSMKVAERTAQLTRRNEELNQAVTQVTQAEARLKQLAYFDSLTSLPNRQLFLERLGRLIDEAVTQGKLLALIFMDLDNFKRINDSLGHSIGDQLLKAVADRLAHCLRSSDSLALFTGEESGSSLGISRLGGDEFTVLLKNLVNVGDAARVAQRILDSMKETFVVGGHELVVTPSIGISIAPHDADTVEELVKMADTAMYHAKKSGKNTFMYYSDEMMVASASRLQIETDLRRAVERNEMCLHFQPQVDISDGRIVGAEALLRWFHPTRGLISPTEFIPLAEEMGLITELGDWVIREACLELKEMQRMGLDVPTVSVNVSSLQFSPSFSDKVQGIIKETGISPEMLMIELTEGTLMSQSDYVINTLLELKALGIRLAIDDFGTGYSSLSYLAKFPIDELKIDRSFVVQIGESDSGNSKSLIDAIVAMAKSLDLEIVAEGVDNEIQLNYLRSLGVHVIQGYLFSKPLLLEEFILFLENNPFPKALVKMVAASAHQ